MNENLLKFFNYDLTACNVWLNKYKAFDEETPLDSDKRYVKEIAEIEYDRLSKISRRAFVENLQHLSDYGVKRYQKLLDVVWNPKLTKEAKLRQLELYFLQFINFQRIVLGGSMLQGIGHHQLYSSLSNCLVLGEVHDSYGGISLKTEELAQTMKRRMGAGLNISKLRPNGSSIHNQASWSSGPILFADRFSYITREIAQYGRRGALMLNIEIAHPDSIEFGEHKQDLRNLTGANISILLDDEYLEAVENQNEYYFQRFPVDYDITGLNPDDFEFNKLTKISGAEEVYVKKINPVEAWEKIIKFAWATGEPCLLFISNWKKWGTDYVYPRYRPVSTNPCSEIPMQAYDTCRLIATNLLCLYDKNKNRVNYDLLETIFYEQQVIIDIAVDLDSIYIDRIINKIQSDDREPEELKQREISIWEKIKSESISGRRTGSGFTGLGDLFAKLGLKYASSESLVVTKKLFSGKMEAELKSTIDMAILYGAFEGFDPHLEFGKDLKTPVNKMFANIEQNFPELTKKMKLFGRRNVSWSTAAPTGSVSMMTQTTSGIEPVFKTFSFRRIKCTKPTDRVDFIDPADGEKFTVYKTIHPQFVQWVSEQSGISIQSIYDMEETELRKWYEQSPWFGSEADDISWLNRVKLQSIVQQFTTHAISSTVNLPNSAKVEDVAEIYTASWKYELKGISVFRDGSRAGVIISMGGSTPVSSNSEQPKKEEFKSTRAPKRPLKLKAKRFEILDKLVYIGLMDSKPFELFICENPLKVKTGKVLDGEIIKVEKGLYKFVIEDELNETGYEHPTEAISNEIDDYKDISLYLSMSLRHGTPLKFVIKTINKTEPIAGSFTYHLTKILSSFIENNTSSGQQCPNCNDMMVYENGCVICKSCGWTKC